MKESAKEFTEAAKRLADVKGKEFVKGLLAGIDIATAKKDGDADG